MGEIETVEAEKMGWLDLPRGTSYPTFPYFGMFSGTPSFDLEFDLEDDLGHKNKGHIRIQRPKLYI